MNRFVKVEKMCLVGALSMFTIGSSLAQTWIIPANGSTGGTGIGTTAGDFNILAGNTGVIRVQANGNIGIGVTSPTQKLSVGGNLGWNSNKGLLTSSQGGSIELGSGDGLANTAGATPFIDFHYGTAAFQDFNVRVINNGDKRLDFIAPGAGTMFSLNNGTVWAKIPSSASDGSIFNFQSDAKATAFILDGNGVGNNVRFRMAVASLGTNGATDCNGCWNSTAEAWDAIIGPFSSQKTNLIVANSSPNGTIRFTTKDQVDIQRMEIRNDGKVVIGEPAGFTQGFNGNYKLYVADGILAERVKCAIKTTTNWADYVFEKDYKLKSIGEVEEYIQKNKHLPGIPSAQDVVKEGIDLAAMDAKLLEKIEEMMLYIIELKKENELLKKAIQK